MERTLKLIVVSSVLIYFVFSLTLRSTFLEVVLTFYIRKIILKPVNFLLTQALNDERSTHVTTENVLILSRCRTIGHPLALPLSLY